MNYDDLLDVHLGGRTLGRFGGVLAALIAGQRRRGLGCGAGGGGGGGGGGGVGQRRQRRRRRFLGDGVAPRVRYEVGAVETVQRRHVTRQLVRSAGQWHHVELDVALPVLRRVKIKEKKDGKKKSYAMGP